VFSLSSNSLRLLLRTESLLPCYILHDEALPTEAAALIHPSAWKGNSQKSNFRFTAFSEVRFGELRKSGHREDAPGALMVHTHTPGDVDSRRTL
jgi:hypothetical protein